MKKKSPFLNAYSSPGGVSASFAKTNAEPITFQSISEEGVVEGTSDDGGNPTADKLKKESKVYQPGLHKKLAKAKSRFKEQKIQSRIDNKTIKDEGKAARLKVKKAIPQAKKIKNQNQKTADLIDKKANKKEFLIKNKKMEQKDFKGSALKYINPNTLAVQGDAGTQQNNISGIPAPEQQSPNRAGRPVNSNVLINDPNNYQNPSTISAQQDSQAQMFGGLAQMGNNPDPVMDNNINNSAMPGDQPSPFNLDTDPPKKQRMAYSKKMAPAKKAYSLAQRISLDKKDTVSYELRPGKTTMEQFGTNADGSPNMIPSTTYSKNRISNKEYANRMGNRLDKAKTPLKKNWIKGAIKKPGQLHKDLGVPQGEKIPKSKLNAAADGKYGKKTQQRANLAKTLSKFKK